MALIKPSALRASLPLLLALLPIACGAAPDAPVDDGPLASVAEAVSDSCAGPPAISCANGSLTAPLPTCSAANPCTHVSGAAITGQPGPPACLTSGGSNHPFFNDGAPFTWNDVNGDARSACYHFPTTTPLLKRPLVIFLHGAQGSATGLYDNTLLRAKSDTFPLSTNLLAKGFVVAALGARSLHWWGPFADGPHFDHHHRDLGTYSANPDIRVLDGLIDAMVQTGKVDRRQIYVVGWSNGGFMAQLYAMARHATPTPGGNKVAAAVAYASGNPLAGACPSASCELPPFATGAPIYLVHRDCDAMVACDDYQSTHLSDLLSPTGFHAPPPAGYVVEPWKQALVAAGDPSVQDTILASNGAVVGACSPLCGYAAGTVNHLRWPDGIADGSGLDREVAMLLFLRAHLQP